MTTTQTNPLRYQGSRSVYVDIAQRGPDEHLGLAVEYAVHPQTNTGCFIVRFIAHGKGISPEKYKHLMYREPAKFLIPASKDHPVPETFKGVRLNKIAIEIFQPAVYRQEVEQYATKLGVWPLLTEWIAEQVVAEGFTITVDLEVELRGFITLPATPEGTDVKSVISFPDLSAPEQQAAALKLVQKPEVEDEEEDEDDGDDKPWLN